MARKSKQPGGHNPLTAHERKKLLGAYGTTTARLGTDSQQKFGYCCLGLQPAADPVATPSGHIYNREAIVSYLLTKTQDYKKALAAYEGRQTQRSAKRQKLTKEKEEEQLAQFERKNKGASQLSDATHSQALVATTQINLESRETATATLKRTSYWLSEMQPAQQDILDTDELPPKRPASPMSGEPLRIKDLTPLDLRTDDAGGFTCAVSDKSLTTQPVVAITKSGQVMLKSVFDELARPTMTCPITGKKFKEKHVLTLQKGSSGFAASGSVTAKKYRPTMT
uniref:Nitric oxide synthase-interacting protein zinc-finger domain-containing protein n=1 Tax=Attheya septentrionalis TaxID=420275 RepID=A0A7S2UPF1_9STRA|mmetsp:Transcript_3827/g.6922  ORF Transcript_3827/g.6922 Transcript_3827/m.6922 type:complete len:282 (+) Transcript_3827:257-1102(+)|eukprot:CAMPEP_0198306338 /NCGR_PEP_ID=MMETSP1449-20131203/58365_1 /TAXON_ID=420275 /ORGANISM="Attheya septentrionalis, Strain CCMP2084" /LENGTH=281 /DNA_ID=CAMNT_0044008891 /DNA_START=620 /DNA_END=1465 /DNA_ORIENTATION=+